MELVVPVFVVIGLLGLLAYARQVNRYGEKVAQRFRLPLFITIGLTVLILLALLAVPDLLLKVDLQGLWVILILATWMAVFVAMIMNRRTGTVLLRIGPARPIPMWLLGVFAVVNIVPVFHYPITDRLYLALAMLTLVAHYLFANTLPVQITEKGFYGYGKIADWQTIRTYSWAKPINGVEFLVLQLKGRWPIFRRRPYLSRQRARSCRASIAPAGCGPTRRAADPPSAKVEHQF